MRIGIPKETLKGERRVAITPEVAKSLIAKGLEVCVERGAGESAHFHDAGYSEVGARLVERGEALDCDLIAKVRRPSVEDVAQMRKGGLYIGLMETCGEDEVAAAMHARDMTVLALERIPRISRAQSMDVLSSQANIAGYRAVIEAAARYERFMPMMMTAAGSAKPARVVVLGVGVAGLQAIATARRLGAEVYAYDVRPETREQILSLGAKPIDLDIGEEGSGEGGYARELSDEAKARQQQLLADELAKAHIIVTTAQIPCRPAPVLVVPEVVERMREGSVIIDMAAGSGGNCPLSRPDEIVTEHGVIIVGHTNYPSMMATDASTFYARNIANFLDLVLEQGGEGKPKVKDDLDADEITAAAQFKPQSSE